MLGETSDFFFCLMSFVKTVALLSNQIRGDNLLCCCSPGPSVFGFVVLGFFFWGLFCFEVFWWWVFSGGGGGGRVVMVFLFVLITTSFSS